MILKYPERLAQACLAASRPRKDNHHWDKGSSHAWAANSQAIDKVGLSWHIRHASLVAIANRPQYTLGIGPGCDANH